jgi:RNA:NAD 2'-phosphotransferase (TPT1/KptA family)
MKRLGIIALLACTGLAMAAPSPLVVDKKVKKSVKAKHIEAVHLEIPTGTLDLAKIRYAIVQGMMLTKGRVWTYEGEDDGSIRARFDYRGHTIAVRIEYNEELVQIKFHGGSEAYQCEVLVDDGICYRNHKNYYKYTPNLRASIAQQLQAL